MIPHPDLERRYIEIHEGASTRPGRRSSRPRARRARSPGRSGVKMLGPYDYVPPVYWYVDTRERRRLRLQHRDRARAPGPARSRASGRCSPRTSSGPSTTSGISIAAGGCSRPSTATTRPWTAAWARPRASTTTLRKAQFLNYEAMRAMFEAFVANKHKATGVIQWMYNSAWPKLWWQLYDYYLQPNGAFYGARKAGEPVHILYNYGTQEIVAVNSTSTPSPKLKATIRVLDFGLKEVIAKTVDFGLLADEVKTIDVLRLPGRPDPDLLPRPAHLQGERPARRRQLLLPLDEARDARRGELDLVRDADQGFRRPHRPQRAEAGDPQGQDQLLQGAGRRPRSPSSSRTPRPTWP